MSANKTQRFVKVRIDHDCDNDTCHGVIRKGELAKVVSVKRMRVSGVGQYWESYYFHPKCEVTILGMNYGQDIW